jgi:transcription-repair coupling factor (superfamily II helicase)
LGQRIVQFQTFDQERKDLGAFLGTDFIVHHLETHPLPIVGGNIELFYERLEKWLKSGTQVLIYSSFKGQEERIRELLTIKGLTTSSTNPMVLPEEITQGFVYPELNLVLLSDHEVFGYKPVERKYRFEEEAVPLPDVRELKPGDFVVHINYGIGRFIGINNITIEGKRGDFVTLEYADGARLYVPVDQYNLIQRYIGDESHPPALNRLGGVSWDRAKERVKKSARKMAKELLELYAARVALKGFSFSPDTSWQREFEAGFAYEETPDQIRAIKEIKRDMEKDRPMDRLVCGDVGYGKTEVAIRAAFKCIMDNKQVAVLVPTTILADQHYKTFCQRFESFPIRVEMLSRFKTRREQRKIIEDLKTGRVDVVVGTHRLLQKDIQFRDLGLVVVDEEQRFGVSHKEKLKKLKRLVDVLTLTATPIPRTLYMSLSGVRDITIINTPIPGRLPIRTFIYRSNPDIIREAVLREMARGGQVFFVHNRIQTIPSVYRMLTSLIPEARVVVAHGQMDKRELERAMMEFLDYRYDVLLSTSIIESGLDIPNVNTIIINDCHRFGLSELYQLRGRVGRSHRLAYAYLLYPPHLALSPQVKKRLQAIKEFTALGSGLALSLRDLEIRGVGNILGPEQSGSIQAVGFDLYCKLLHQTVAELKGEEVEEEISPQILLQCNAFIPESCLPDEDRRFLLYRRMCGCEDEEALNEIRRELQDFCGRELPQEVQNLLDVMSIKLLAKKAGIPKVSSVKGGVELELQDGKGMVSRLTKTLERFPALRLNPRQPNKLFIPLQGKGFKEDAQVLKDVLFNLA